MTLLPPDTRPGDGEDLHLSAHPGFCIHDDTTPRVYDPACPHAMIAHDCPEAGALIRMVRRGVLWSLSPPVSAPDPGLINGTPKAAAGPLKRKIGSP